MIRTIEARLYKRARQPAQHRPGLRRQVVPARYLVLFLPLLLMQALREIDYVSSSGVLAERLLSMQDERLGRWAIIIGCHRVVVLSFALWWWDTRCGRGRLLWVQPHRDGGPETGMT